MKTCLHLLMLGALAACTVPALAQRAAPHKTPFHRLQRAMPVEPLRMARAVCTVGPDGKMKPVRIGAWIPYSRHEVGITTQMNVAYDEYEFVSAADPDLTPGDNPLYAGCGFGDGRWVFGGGYNKGYTYNDLHVVPSAKGTESTRLAWAWSMIANTVNDFEYFVFTGENFPVTAGPGTGANDPGPAGRGDYPGIVYSYGALAQNPPNTYYFSAIDLSTGTLSHHLPNDGDGGVLTLFGDVNTVTNQITLIGEPALWGLVPGNPTPPCSPNQWDDDNPIDLLFTDGTGGTNNELYDYSNPGSCPLILGAMMCMFGPPAATETLAPVSEVINLGTTNSGGNLASWAADDNNARRVCKFFVPNGTSPYARINLGFTTTKSSPTAIAFEVKAKTETGGGFAIRLFVQNKVSNAFDLVLNNTALTLAYAVYTGNAGGTLTNYVGGGGAMNGQIEIQQTGPSASTLPCSLFEYANMKVTG